MSSAAFALPERALVLDRYRPLKPLGRGGSGSVWLARDERTGLDVALKIVPREGKRAARASREMEAATRLRHERCVRAYDFGGDTGHVYIAYEYVRGRTLREVLRSGDVDDATAVEIAAQVLDGLAHAHRNGIVHRDVKPSNVLVEETDGISVRVLDFGLAQFDEADTLTAVGDVPGTLAYISPERLGGQEATERSDVWAVGVILWESLAGSHPFWGVPMPEVASTIASGAPPLSARRGDLPRRLLAAVDNALSIDPARRPTAARLAAELREAFVVPRHPGPERRREAPRRPRKAPRARPLAVAVPFERRVVPAALAALATAVGGSLLPFWPAPLLAALAVAWRDPRAGLAFCAGPLLAPLGLIALLPLAVQPARGAWRRGLHAAAGVLTAAAVAGLSGAGLPITGVVVGDLGLEQNERPTDVLDAVGHVLRASPELATTALALALVAALLPRAAARGPWGIAGLGALQLSLVLAWAPSVPWAGIVLGTWLLCALLYATPLAVSLARERSGAAASPSRTTVEQRASR